MNKQMIKPCPFCGNRNFAESGDESNPEWGKIRAEKNKAEGGAYVFCIGCGARGPKREYEKKAIAAWNRRGMHEKKR
ncbi:MAG: Lar family restriction alleviation protein [Treponema sp.]|jgi:Lar family restriction alleviation protein|nr:Lar family restriction alleviation protein [Treponema sp.]